LRLVLGEQGLGQEPDGSHGRLQLVADVRHEVTPDVSEAATFGHVVDDRDHPESALAIVDAFGANNESAPGRPVQLEHPFLVSAGRCRCEELFDGLGSERVPVAASDESDGPAVAEHVSPRSSVMSTAWGRVSRARRSRMASELSSATGLGCAVGGAL